MLLVPSDTDGGKNVPFVIQNTIRHKQSPQERPDVMIRPVLWSKGRNQIQLCDNQEEAVTSCFYLNQESVCVQLEEVILKLWCSCRAVDLHEARTRQSCKLQQNFFRSLACYRDEKTKKEHFICMKCMSDYLPYQQWVDSHVVWPARVSGTHGGES